MCAAPAIVHIAHKRDLAGIGLSRNGIFRPIHIEPDVVAHLGHPKLLARIDGVEHGTHALQPTVNLHVVRRQLDFLWIRVIADPIDWVEASCAVLNAPNEFGSA